MAAEALLDHLRRGVPQPIWVQYAQALQLAGYAVEREHRPDGQGWLITGPDGKRYGLARRDDGFWQATEAEPRAQDPGSAPSDLQS